jgi:hypothetical protein
MYVIAVTTHTKGYENAQEKINKAASDRDPDGAAV